MTAEELKNLIDANEALVIDVRLGRAFTESHIPGALSAPFSQRGWGAAVAGWLRREAPGKSVVLFGDNKVLAESAQKALDAEQVSVQAIWDGGMGPWAAAGLPIVAVQNVTVDALRQALTDWRVIDVREPYELRSGIIPGAVNIPIGQLTERIGELQPDQRYAIVCASGNRSQSAAAWMAEQGYQVANVVGGMSLWIGGGHPVER
ncbi:MAG: rhodanese-like domain-containing protein [Firmicutes bacterium]|nr:rhodanese-like domain-containing protein [Bacillota bacterium]